MVQEEYDFNYKRESPDVSAAVPDDDGDLGGIPAVSLPRLISSSQPSR